MDKSSFSFIKYIDRKCSLAAVMIQTGLIQNAHSDLVTDASYDFYGLRLATCSLDQRFVAFSSYKPNLIHHMRKNKDMAARRS